MAESASASPSVSPSVSPSASPSASPSVSFSASPSSSPSASPSASPSVSPSASPSNSPSASPSMSPSASPSEEAYSVATPTEVAGMRGVKVIKWTGLQLTGDIGTPYACPNYPDKSVQLVGAFGAGGTVVIEGSNMVVSDPTADATFATLNDSMGVPLSLTSPGIKQISENTYWIRPRVTMGAFTTSVDVYLLIETVRG